MARRDNLERLLLEHLELSRPVITRIVRQEADVDDVKQEQFLKLYEMIREGKLSVRTSFKGLIARTAVTSSIDFLRGRNGRQQKKDTEELEPDSILKRRRPRSLSILENQIPTSDDGLTANLLAADSSAECIRLHDPKSLLLKSEIEGMTLDEIVQFETNRKIYDQLHCVQDGPYFDSLHSVRKQIQKEKEEWQAKRKMLCQHIYVFTKRMRKENGASFSHDTIEKIMSRYDPPKKSVHD